MLTQLRKRFFGRATVDTKPVVLNQRRIFIVPGSRGFGFALLILLLLLVAFVYNNNLTYILAFLLASIFFISILHSFKALSGLIIQPGKTRNVFAGEAAPFQIHIKNPANSKRFSLQIKSAQGDPVQLDVEAHSTALVTLYDKTGRRGRQALGAVTVYSYFPFGLFRSWSVLHFDLTTLVYPQPSVIDQPFPEYSTAPHQPGFNRQGDDDFYGLTDYQNGDPIRRIHWKAYAKGQGLYSKQYSGTSTAQIWLDYEYTPGNNVEQRLSQLCRWVIEAERASLLYGFKIPGLRLEPNNGPLHSRKCLEALALFGEPST